MTPNPHQHPSHHLRWDGDRRAAIIGLPQAGGTTIAIHLLRALTRLAVPAVGLDQTQPHTFATVWGHARRAITGHGHWPQVRQLRNADHMASIRHQVVVVDVGHSDDLRRRCAALATVVVVTVGNRNVTGNDADRAAIDEFANLAVQFPTHVPRLLVASHIDGHESAIAPATLAGIAGRLGAQTTLQIPHYDLLPAAVARGDDIWSYRRNQPPTADLTACREAMRDAMLAIIDRLCSGPPGWRNNLRDLVIREAALQPQQTPADAPATPPRIRIHEPGAEADGPLFITPDYPGLVRLNFTTETSPVSASTDPFGAPTFRAPSAAIGAPRGPSATARKWAWLPRSATLDPDTAAALERIIDRLECDTTEAIRTALRHAVARIQGASPADLGVPLPDVARGTNSHKCNFQLGPRLDAAWADLAGRLEPQRKNKTRALRWAIRLLDREFHGC